MLTVGVSTLSQESLENASSNLTLPVGWRDNIDGSSPTNSTQPSRNISVGDAQIFCSGTKYRNNLKSDSCLHALIQIPNDPTNLRFSMRGLSRQYDVALPARWISRECLLPTSSKGFQGRERAKR